MFLIKRFILKVHINNCNKGPGSRNRDNRRNPRGNEMYTLWHIINRAYKLTVICGYKLHITWRRCNDILFPLTILRQLRTNSNKCLRQKLNVILWWNNGRIYLPFLDTFNYVSSPAHLNIAVIKIRRALTPKLLRTKKFVLINLPWTPHKNIAHNAFCSCALWHTTDVKYGASMYPTYVS